MDQAPSVSTAPPLHYQLCWLCRGSGLRMAQRCALCAGKGWIVVEWTATFVVEQWIA